MTFEELRTRLTDIMDKFSCEAWLKAGDKVKSDDYVVQDIMEVLNDLEEDE